MRIKTQLVITSATAFVAILLVAAVLLGTTKALKNNLGKNEMTGEAIRSLATLSVLLNEFKDAPSERLSSQLKTGIANFGQSIRSIKELSLYEDHHLIRSMETHLNEFATLQNQMHEFDLTREDPSGIEFRSIVVGELFVTLDLLASDAHKLQQMGRGRNDAYWTRSGMASVAILLVALGIITAYSAFVARDILKPVTVFAKAAKAIGGGDYSARTSVGGNSEIAALSRVFDVMANDLEKSIGELHTEIERRRRSEEALKEAIEKIKTLHGLLPICASCKKIRDDHGAWTMLEKYIGERTDAVFSHGICPDCTRKLYPEFADALESASDTGSPPSSSGR